MLFLLNFYTHITFILWSIFIYSFINMEILTTFVENIQI